MSESQRPKPTALEFVVPDLELEPAPRSRANAALPAAAATPRGYSTPNLFDEDPFETGNLDIELNQNPGEGKIDFGSSIDFAGQGAFELEPTARGSSTESGPQSIVTRRAEPSNREPAWPSGRTPEAETLTIDPVEVTILADYGVPPNSVYLTPGYAYRVFTRQRQLKQRLAVLCVERDQAQAEREATLADLASSVRPAAEQVDAFKRFLVPLLELEQVASQRGQALSSVNAELNAHSGAIDNELTQLAEQLTAEQKLEAEAARVHGEREQLAQRADAKLKRVHIEIRAVTHVAEQKLGPQGGQIPDPEATQLTSLRQRADAMQPELARTKADLEQAKLALGQARARLDTLRQAERQSLRKKQALADHYRKELQVRSVGLSESEQQRRSALADLGRAVLAAQGSVPVPAPWLERVRSVSARADQLILRCEAQRRAQGAYDRARVAQGVRLVCTALALVVLLVALKLLL
jgi:hypothetical protein